MDYFEQVDLAYQTLKGPALERAPPEQKNAASITLCAMEAVSVIDDQN